MIPIAVLHILSCMDRDLLLVAKDDETAPPAAGSQFDKPKTSGAVNRTLSAGQRGKCAIIIGPDAAALRRRFDC